MMIDRKAQITFFIIIGIVLIIIFLMLFVILSKTTEEQQEREIEKIVQVSMDIKPVQDFAQSCIDLTVKNAIYSLGKQGGILFDVQGGPVPLAALSSGIDYLYLVVDDVNVQYSIKPFTSGIGAFSHIPPDYPYEGFPLAGQAPLYRGLYGWVNFLQLEDIADPGNMDTIKGQLKYFIEKGIPECTNGFVNFPSFNVTEGLIDANISFLDKAVSVNINYPLDIRKRATDDFIHIEEFNIYLDFRMKDMYYFVRDLLHHESISIIHEFQGKSYGAANVKKIDKDVNGGFDDVIIIEDSSFFMEGSPFRLNLLIDNRPPALHYISVDNLPALSEGYRLEGSDNDLLIIKDASTAIIYNFSEKIKNINPELKIFYDPDEGENLTVDYSLDLPLTINAEDVDIGSKYLTVFVSDGEFTDYQEIRFEVVS